MHLEVAERWVETIQHLDNIDLGRNAMQQRMVVPCGNGSVSAAVALQSRSAVDG
jgi:hypothetical protein